MILGLFRRSPNEAVIQRLYATIVAASRQPTLYSSIGVADTFEGRFETLTLHAVLVLRRLRGCDAPGPEMAQHLIDTIFAHFDRTLREMGVGDTSVPKRMKTLAEAFLGRRLAYDEALREGHDALVAALAKNIGADRPAALAIYVERVAAEIEAMPLQAFVDGNLLFHGPLATSTEVTT